MTLRLDGKTYWIIGASEGLGRALSRMMHERGATLILTARSEGRLKDLADELSGSRVVTCDVTDAASVTAAAEQAGEIDGMVYSAGFYEPMSAKEWDADAALAMCEVDFMGVMRILGHVVPDFVEKGSGHIVLIGSLSGHRGLPGAIGYGVSKAAVIHLAENLYADLRKTDISVQVVNPGFIETRLTDKNDFRMPMIMTPEQAAGHVMAAMESGRLSTNFPAPFSWLFTLGKYLPFPLFARIFDRS